MEHFCKNCERWVIPTWDTNNFGTCYLPSHLRDHKKLPMFVAEPARAYLTTREDFGCNQFEVKLRN